MKTIKRILRSRKVNTAIAGFVVTVVLGILAKQFPQYADVWTQSQEYLIMSVGLVIASWAYEDGKAKEKTGNARGDQISRD